MNATPLKDAFDPAKLKDGLYVTAADLPAYPLLRAMSIVGAAKQIGTAFEPDGREIGSFAVGKTRPAVRQNPAMPLDERYRQKVVTADYSGDWEEKWWREAIQNSVDAKATNIHCYAMRLSDETWRCGCVDNGRGMSRDVMVGKLLVFGGSTKDEDGDEAMSGGFGKAKELLILPWMDWWVQSRDHAAVGVGNVYSLYQAVGGKWMYVRLTDQLGNLDPEKPLFQAPPVKAENLSGTQIEAHFAASKYTTIVSAMVYVEKCYLPNVTFLMETNYPEHKQVEMQGLLRNGRTQEEVPGKARIHYTKAQTTSPAVLVRTKEGLYMFKQRLFNDIEGFIIVELLVKAVKKPNGEMQYLLTSNRDGFADYQVETAVDRFRDHLAKNTKSALRAKRAEKDLIVEPYPGEQMTAAQQSQREASLVAAIRRCASGTKLGTDKYEVPEEAVNMVQEQLERDYKAADETANPENVNTRANGEVAGVLLQEKFVGMTSAENAMKNILWKPGFIIRNEVPGFHVPQKFKPTHMTPSILRLAKFWAEMCRLVMLRLGYGAGWNVGFNFDNGSRAAFFRHEGKDYLMLNPFKLSENGMTDVMLNVAEESDRNFMFALAIHECTHLVNHEPDHEEAFLIAYNMNVALCGPVFKRVNAIYRAMPLRNQPEFEAKRKEKERLATAVGRPDEWDKMYVKSVTEPGIYAVAGPVAPARADLGVAWRRADGHVSLLWFSGLKYWNVAYWVEAVQRRFRGLNPELLIGREDGESKPWAAVRWKSDEELVKRGYSSGYPREVELRVNGMVDVHDVNYDLIEWLAKGETALLVDALVRGMRADKGNNWSFEIYDGGRETSAFSAEHYMDKVVAAALGRAGGEPPPPTTTSEIEAGLSAVIAKAGSPWRADMSMDELRQGTGANVMLWQTPRGDIVAAYAKGSIAPSERNQLAFAADALGMRATGTRMLQLTIIPKQSENSVTVAMVMARGVLAVGYISDFETAVRAVVENKAQAFFNAASVIINGLPPDTSVVINPGAWATTVEEFDRVVQASIEAEQK